MSLDYIANFNPDEKAHRRLITDTLNGALDGKLRVTGSVTLTAGATTTTVEDNKFESNMVPLLIPTTANAATATANVYVSARTQGSFTLTHANNGQTDRTFLYVRLG